jgi:excinuclease ABC subunit A
MAGSEIPPSSSRTRPIRIVGVRQNNLKNLTLEFPPRKMTVITGLSGSGKSSLAFDTLYAEGQRRYVESLSTYTRQFLEKMPRPDVERVENIPPSIALEQRNTIVNSRSTVGTQTEIVDYLRLLYAKVGETLCVDCGSRVERITSNSILETALEWFLGRKGVIVAPLKLTPPAGASKKKRPSQSFLQVLQESGFRRLLQVTRNKTQWIDLEDNASDLSSPDGLFAVVDRLRFDDAADPELRARLLDSIDQAIAIGRGEVAFHDLESHAWKRFSLKFACRNCEREHKLPEPHLFSFNSPLGACAQCSGFGFTLDLDESKVVPDPSKTLKNGAIDPLSKPSFEDWQKDMFRFAERHGISIGKRYRDLTVAQKKLLWDGHPDDKTFPGIHRCFSDLAKWKYKLHIRVFIRRYQNQKLCSQCEGSRLNADALAVKVSKLNIAQALSLPVAQARVWLKELKLSSELKRASQEILSQLERRLRLLDAVGVPYLTLNRLAKTLSGGEFQRINLATQLGNGLCGTLYVLDEPSIGLHARDTEQLISVLEELRDQGNTIVVVEHDLEVMKAADHLVELGPGSGRRGGELIAEGSAKDLIAHKGSITGRYLAGDFSILKGKLPRPPSKKVLKITGCREHNLQNLNVEFPLERFVVLTGVSGSGKSTLLHQTLYQALARMFKIESDEPGAFDRIYGAEHIRGVVLLDQTPIGRSSRSNPATYLKAWDEIRRIYSNQVLSLKRGYTAQYFSFNVEGGRCSVCKGEGEITIDMHFMAEVNVRCEECDGKRFRKPVLDVQYRGKNIHALLQTTIDEAYDLFRDNGILARKFGILREVGLGYLQVGQSSTTLSGGESQRLKIAHVLDEQAGQNLLYIFDEPTTGLHHEDIKKLLEVLQDLVADHNSVIMIEHHLDVIAQADWVIDLGPTGGEGGGRLLASAPPDLLVQEARSITGQMLLKQGYTFAPRERTDSRSQLKN